MMVDEFVVWKVKMVDKFVVLKEKVARGVFKELGDIQGFDEKKYPYLKKLEEIIAEILGLDKGA